MYITIKVHGSTYYHHWLMDESISSIGSWGLSTARYAEVGFRTIYVAEKAYGPYMRPHVMAVVLNPMYRKDGRHLGDSRHPYGYSYRRTFRIQIKRRRDG